MATVTMRFIDDEDGGVNVMVSCNPPLDALNEGSDVTPAMDVAVSVLQMIEVIKEQALKGEASE